MSRAKPTIPVYNRQRHWRLKDFSGNYSQARMQASTKNCYGWPIQNPKMGKFLELPRQGLLLWILQMSKAYLTESHKMCRRNHSLPEEGMFLVLRKERKRCLLVLKLLLTMPMLILFQLQTQNPSRVKMRSKLVQIWTFCQPRLYEDQENVNCLQLASHQEALCWKQSLLCHKKGWSRILQPK